MALQIKKATKRAAKLRLALLGPSGAGKTFTALSIASHLGQKILVVDTENASAAKYSDSFDFDVIELNDFAPANFIEAINLAARNGYDALIVDSLSHAWMGRNGILEMHDHAVDRQKSKNSFTAWKDVTPEHNRLIEAIVQAKIHIIATMRSKVEHIVNKDEKSGRTTVEKVGMAAVQREGMDYEFDVVGELEHRDNTLVITKTRCAALFGGVYKRAGREVAEILKTWLDGEPVTETPPAAAVSTAGAGVIRQSLDNREREQIVGEITQLLKEMDKPESGLQKWFAEKYDTDSDWREMGLAVLREILEQVKVWKKRADAAAEQPVF